MTGRIVSLLIIVLCGCSLPAIAVTGPETAVDPMPIALMPGAAQPALMFGSPAPAAPETANPTSSALRLTRSTGEVFAGATASDTIVSTNCELPSRAVVKTGKTSWCEVQFADVVVRCWQNSECVFDSIHQLVHVKAGNVIIRKSGLPESKELLIVAGDRTILLEHGVANVAADPSKSN